MPRRLLWSLLGASIVLNVMYGAVAGVLVPAQVALADPESKETHLAIIMALSSLATLVAQPAAGAASDRTRTRWGRRRPWIAGSAVPVALALVALGRAETLLAITVGWIVVQPLLNVLEAPLDAILADRFSAGQRPGPRRSTAAALQWAWRLVRWPRAWRSHTWRWPTPCWRPSS